MSNGDCEGALCRPIGDTVGQVLVERVESTVRAQELTFPKAFVAGRPTEASRVGAFTASGSGVLETHLSLLFVGDRVFKLRKPVTFDFVDFAERRAREVDCRTRGGPQQPLRA